MIGVLATALLAQSTGSTGGGGGGAAAPPEADITISASSASVAQTNLVTSGAVGLRRIDYHMWMNAACTTGFTTNFIRLRWNDGGARIFSSPSVQASSGVVGITRRYVSGSILVHLASGQDISYETTVGNTCTTGTASYNIRFIVNKL
jgi:hypothetical protein